jgi:hypothetical protein
MVPEFRKNIIILYDLKFRQFDLLLRVAVKMKMSMELWWYERKRGKSKYSEVNPSFWHSVLYKFHTKWPSLDTGH